MLIKIWVLVLGFFLEGVTTLFFDMAETEQKCFIEEVPENTIVVGEYKLEVLDPHRTVFVPASKSIAMLVSVTDPNDKVILKMEYTATGRFSFSADTPGEHFICLKTNSSTWFGKELVRVHLNINVGEHAQDYQVIGTQERLTELQLRVRQLLDQVNQISKEQNYQKQREQVFRKMSVTTNSRLVRWAFAQLFVLIAIGVWQMRHLRGFFETKKLV